MRRRTWIKALGTLVGGAFIPSANSIAGQETLQLRFNLDMSNPGGRDLPTQHAWMYLPVRRDAWWTLDDVDIRLPHELQGDPLGHVILRLSIGNLSAYARRTAVLIVDLKRNRTPMPAVKEAEQWLRPERYIESDHEEIVVQSRALSAETDAQTVRNIHDFVHGSMVYAGYMPEDFGAAYALQRRRGDCTEYACLVVALCRASGIPARMVEGYVTDRSFAPKPMDFHDWAEVLIDGQWQIVDAQKDALVPQDARYIAFRYYRDTPSNGVGSAHRYRVEGEMELSL